MARSAAAVWSDSDHCVAFHRGRVALHAILRAFDVGDGDEVLLPGFTCVAVPAAILYTGAQPRFVDIDAQTLNLDEGLLARALDRRPAAVVLQHAFGSPGVPETVLEMCRERGIRVIEDCAHATGASHRGIAVGEFGDAAFTSLQWSKTVSCGLGGVARMRESSDATRLRQIAQSYPEPGFLSTLTLKALVLLKEAYLRPEIHDRARGLYRRLGRWRLVPGSSSAEELLRAEIPSGYRRRFATARRDQLESALGCVEKTIAHRRRVASRFRAWLEQNGYWTQALAPGAVSTHLRVPILVRSRDSILARAREARLELGDWFQAPLHPASSPASVFGYRTGSCPVSEERTAQLVNLPTHERMDEGEIERHVAFLDAHRAELIESSGRTQSVQERPLESVRE